MEITLTTKMTYGEARKAFADAFGGLLKVKASEADTMAALGLTADVTIKDSDTAAAVNAAVKIHGQKATVRTIDDWVAVIDDMPMSMVSRIGKNSTKVKMLAMLDSNSEATPAPAPAPTPAPKPAPAPTSGAEAKADKPKPQSTQSAEETDEDMGEILNRIKTLEEALKKLQAQMAKLEKSTAAAPQAAAGQAAAPASEKEYVMEALNITRTSYVRDSDGSKRKFYKSAKQVNYDFSYIDIRIDICLTNKGRLLNNRNTKAFDYGYVNDQSKVLMILATVAEDLGYTFSTPLPDNVGDNGAENKKLLVAASTGLTNKFGRFGVLYHEHYLIDSTNERISVYFPSGVQKEIALLSNAEYIGREWANEPFKDNPNWTDTERFNAIRDYVNSLTPKYPGK